MHAYGVVKEIHDGGGGEESGEEHGGCEETGGVSDSGNGPGNVPGEGAGVLVVGG